MSAPAQSAEPGQGLPKRPVTILGGFLGSGKTTLLNHLLRSAGGLRIAVMVNDFGAVNIDKDLVIGLKGEVMELSGGCLCCTIREDLFASARGLLASGRPFDALLVETSGLSDPGVVAQTFLVPGLEESLRLDAVVILVDAANIESSLENWQAARRQICNADLLVVNKLDLLAPEEVPRITARLLNINPRVRALFCVNGKLPISLLLDIDAHREKAAEADDPLHDHDLHHAFASVSFAEEIELDYDELDGFVESLPDGVYRAKGIFAVKGLRRRVLFHRVGLRNVLDQGAFWEGKERFCRALFLGADFDGEGLLARLRGCAAASPRDGSFKPPYPRRRDRRPARPDRF